MDLFNGFPLNRSIFLPPYREYCGTLTGDVSHRKEEKMEIYAKGKNIPTYDFGDLFIQGERFADTIVFVVDRI